MIRLAIYGKGGIGKSTVACNVSAALAEKGLSVLQIGCDPKADSTALLRGEERIPTVLELERQYGSAVSLSDAVHKGYGGVLCVEAGGPPPGVGCAGRGIIHALELLKRLFAEQDTPFRPDAVIYDVLGDVVCGGFSMPMRGGYADRVYVVTSGEKMAKYAAANICMAVENFRGRGYAELGGLILNRRNTENEDEVISALAEEFGTSVVGALDRSTEIQEAEKAGLPVVAYAPDSQAALQLRALADALCAGGNAQ